MRVVIELNGIRYKSVIKRKPTDCSDCDLKKYICGTIIGSPCLNANEVFKRIKEKN